MAKILLVEDNEMNRDMLSRRLQRRDFDVVVAVDVAALPQDLTGVVLPASLYEALKEAVETHSVTEVKKHLGVVEALGAEGQALAEQLRDLVQKFDMDAIKIVLETVDYE